MKKTVGDKVQVKASGGVRSLSEMQAMIEAGATRIGTSSGIKILQGQTSQQAY
jgi:deoxyribose-phosphate aldolase